MTSIFETLTYKLLRKKPSKKETRILALFVFLIVSFSILHMFSIWQLDIICVTPVWNTQRFIQEVNGNIYSQCPFQCWLWRTTIGEAYDILFFLNFLSFYGTIIIFVIMLYWIFRHRVQ